MIKPLYIFDLDGTLALIEHRRHHVEGETKDWRAFFAACIRDRPNLPVINMLRAVRKTGADVWIWSGRSDEVQAETEYWLDVHGIQKSGVLRMRKAGDHQPDVDLKQSWLDELNPLDRGRLAVVFDDRQRVVDMWRAAGVTCFQVAAGNF